MEVTAGMVKELREKTGAGIMDCKEALKECGGEFEDAIIFLRKKGLAVAAKRAGRATKEGTVGMYLHSDGKLAVMVEVNSETDFVAKTDDFKALARDLSMQVAATNPVCVSSDDFPQEVLDREKGIYREQALESGKPEQVVDKIVEGRLKKFFKESTLLDQPFVKDPDKSVQDVINETIAKCGENISVRRFVRIKVGEEAD